MAPALRTAFIITFCIAAVLILVCLRLFFLKRAPLKEALQKLRAKYDPHYRERRLQQQQADLEALAVAASSETSNQQTTRLWYGHRVTEVVVGEGPSRRYYYYRHSSEPTNEPGSRERCGKRKVVLSKREVEFYFPDLEFKNQDQRVIYMSFAAKKNDDRCNYEDISTQDGGDEKEKALDTVMTVSTEVTAVASSEIDDEKSNNIAGKITGNLNHSNKMVATDNMCIICLQKMADIDLTRSMRCCRNVFHSTCILEWLSGYKASCPLCRFDYSLLHDDYEH